MVEVFQPMKIGNPKNSVGQDLSSSSPMGFKL